MYSLLTRTFKRVKANNQTDVVPCHFVTYRTVFFLPITTWQYSFINSMYAFMRSPTGDSGTSVTVVTDEVQPLAYSL